MRFNEWRKLSNWPYQDTIEAFAKDQSHVRELVLSIVDDCPKGDWYGVLSWLEGELDEAFGPDSVWHDYARHHLKG